jgi:indole-3-glycerol phosphate synthase
VAAIGINARNLKDFTVDLERVKELCKYIPKNIVAVAESGMKSTTAGVELRKAGFRGFLVGEYFIRARDRVACVSEFANALKR